MEITKMIGSILRTKMHKLSPETRKKNGAKTVKIGACRSGAVAGLQRNSNPATNGAVEQRETTSATSPILRREGCEQKLQR
ncbi:hypothetical protein AND_009327 [Anopheles darlingi]|uniref:Uncharacterized protein n=1 Tax=Anopheles darlingi TaxID=43151 RepID=W5J8H4_ANODA|nr:hypothetical protein AND_009327 [Anopheles darlingi]